MKCRPVLCGPAQEFDDTKIVWRADQERGMQVYSNVIDYACEEGYSLDGKYGGETKYSLTCNAVGDFAVPAVPTLPSCQPVSCGYAPDIKYGSVAPVKLVYKNTVIAIAEDGHSTTQIANKGNLMSIKCTADGSFS